MAITSGSEERTFNPYFLMMPQHPFPVFKGISLEFLEEGPDGLEF